MSIATLPTAPTFSTGGMSRSQRNTLIIVGTVLTLSMSRWLSGTTDVTSSFTIAQTVISTLPILMCGLGGLLSERSGVVNIGLEGMMVMGTWGAGFFGYHFGPWGALAGAALCGGITGLVHAVVVIRFGVDHVVSGVAINILAGGWARFLASALFKGRGSGSETNSPGFNVEKGMPTLRFPGMADGGFFAKIEKHHWVIVSDVAGLLKGLLGSWPLYRLVAVAMLPLVAWLVWRTKFGLRMRASGERPSAADSLGVQVARIRYIAVSASGALAGLGGALLVLNNTGGYVEGQTNSRGFLGLASLIFGNWRPVGVLGGAALFGFLDTVQLTAEPAVISVYMVLAVGAVYGVYKALRRAQRGQALGLAALAIGLMALFIGRMHFDTDLVKGLPYLGTLIVLAVYSQRLRPPAAAGQPWSKGQIG
jgi:general nucleoside transport system permease protein